jgi:outer membrane translocation and assembly module TamA
MKEPKPKRGKTQKPRESAGPEKDVSSQITHQSRAQSLQRCKFSREFRLRKIVDLMLADEWVKGVTAAELALEWELEVSTVENDSTDASRFIGLCQDAEDVRRHSMVYLRRIAESGEPAAVRAIEVALKASGNLTERIDVTHSARTGPDMFAAALEHEPFRAYLVEQGWKPPKGRPVLTTGSAAP